LQNGFPFFSNKKRSPNPQTRITLQQTLVQPAASIKMGSKATFAATCANVSFVGFRCRKVINLAPIRR